MDAVTVAPLLDGDPYVGVMRGRSIESVHRVAACAVGTEGRVVFAIGSIDVPVYLRSTAKPFIAAAAVREGVAERYGLEPHEIALMAASHNGEPFHVNAVRSILAKIGLPNPRWPAVRTLPRSGIGVRPRARRDRLLRNSQ